MQCPMLYFKYKKKNVTIFDYNIFLILSFFSKQNNCSIKNKPINIFIGKNICGKKIGYIYTNVHRIYT